MRKWYGSLNNRIEENRMLCDEITVGTPLTEYQWSDRHPWEVIEVRDQKHITIRELSHKPVGEPYSNCWELHSNPENRTMELAKRGERWYKVFRDTITNKISSWTKINVTFGKAEYYYDYSF